MGEVSIFYTKDTFGKSKGISLKGGQPCFTFKLGDFLDNSKENSTGVIATNFVIKKDENISVTPTLGTQLFLYVGGESAWQIEIQGLILSSCKKPKDAVNGGFSNLIDWYKSKNVKDSGEAITLCLGKQVYKGYLYRFQIQSEYKFVNCCSFTASFVGVLQ